MTYFEQIEVLNQLHRSELGLKWDALDFLGLVADRLGVLAVRVNSLEDDCLTASGMDRTNYISASLVMITEELVRLHSDIRELLAKDGADNETK